MQECTLRVKRKKEQKISTVKGKNKKVYIKFWYCNIYCARNNEPINKVAF